MTQVPHASRLAPFASRRAFRCDLAGLGVSLAGVAMLAGCSPPAAPASSRRVYRVGYVSPEPTTSAFLDHMDELGYTAGRNLSFESRFVGEDAAEAAAIADELLRLPVDVIVANGPAPALRAVLEATDSVPIVLRGAFADTPLGTGGANPRAFVESLARPGRNVTGTLDGDGLDLDLKRLQLLVEARPGVSRVAVLGGTGPSGIARDLGEWQAAATSLGVALVPLPEGSAEAGYEEAFQRAMAEGADALLTTRGRGTNLNIGLIVGLADRYRLPAMHPRRAWVERGGLMGYEARRSDLDRRSADYVDRILRGARPADLPVELPTRYELTVNLRVARALGITLPLAFLAQVDEVIEG